VRDRLLVAVDMDGTLLNTEDEDHLRPREIAALEAVRAAGHVLAICTGRNRRSLDALLDRSGWNPADLPKIFLNGAVVDGGSEVDLLVRRVLVRDVLARLVQLFRHHGAVPMVYATDEDGGTLLHERGEINPVLARYIRHRRERVGSITDVDDLLDHLPESALEVGSIDLEPVIRPLSAAIEAELGERVSVINTRSLLGEGQYFWAEVYHRRCGKGQGAERLAAAFGIAPDRIVAIGDNYNDLDMFDVAAVSVAVAGGPQEVQAAADLVAAPVEESGAAVVLEDIAAGRFTPLPTDREASA
jgi:Cof subfamily protein (haloacid dehalogenase superfamily)